MKKISWSDFYFGAQNGMLQAGDIVFNSYPDYVGQFGGRFKHKLIKTGQFFRSKISDHDHDEVPRHYSITHAAIAVQHIDNGQFKPVSIAESTEPSSHEISMEHFLRARLNSELIVFRPTVPELRRGINYFAIEFSNQTIPYVKPLARQFLSLVPKKTTPAPNMPLPHSINCSSFIAFVYNAAYFKECELNPNFQHVTQPLPYSDIAPYILYHKLKEKEFTERTWTSVWHVVH